jgi:hypothetical protein
VDFRLTARRLIDLGLNAAQRATGLNYRIDRLAAAHTPVEVLVLGIYTQESLIDHAVRELSRSAHSVQFVLGTLDQAAVAGLEHKTVATEMRGNKFQNINELLKLSPSGASRPRWTLLLDDDVLFPRRFLDRFLALCEHFDLSLAQPAMSRRSHASFDVTRRRPAVLVRETRFVEGGQLTAIREDAAAELLPFPADAGMWGLDLHWAAVAVDRGWRMGVVDATPVRHETRPTGRSYSAELAQEAGRQFVARHRSLQPQEANRTVAVHRSLLRRG